MKMDLIIIGRRVLANGLVLATTIATCTLLQANDHEKNNTSPNSGGPQSSPTGAARGSNLGASQERSVSQPGQPGQQQEKFVQKALKGGQMEVKMGQLAQQNGQNQQVKSLGQRLVQDHTQANQQLQQIAQSLNIQAADATAIAEKPEAKAKHQDPMAKLQGKSSAEFDQEFTKMAIQHHRMNIQEFERAQSRVDDVQLKSFISQILPKLREHLQMAQAAARSVGVDESSIASDESNPSNPDAAGAPATGEQGVSQPDSDGQPRSAIEHDTHGEDGTSISGRTEIENRELSADVEKNDHSAAVNVGGDANDADRGNKLFRKGDGKVLGLPTSKNDGKLLGILPAPGGKKDADVEVDVKTDRDASSVGGPARSESGKSTDRDVEVDVDVDRK